MPLGGCGPGTGTTFRKAIRQLAPARDIDLLDLSGSRQMPYTASRSATLAANIARAPKTSAAGPECCSAIAGRPPTSVGAASEHDSSVEPYTRHGHVRDTAHDGRVLRLPFEVID